jgi:arylsulfatase A-like enzyme
MDRKSSTAALLALLTACSDSSVPAEYDVLVISLDTVRADALTFRDAEAAPNMTALAQGGTVFTQAIAGTSWTLPSHAQLFTGQPPSLHRAEVDDTAMDERTPTLPTLLRDGGWFTAGFWTGWFLSDEYGFARGFDVYRNAMTDGDKYHARFEQDVDSGNTGAGWSAQADRERLSHQDITSERVVDMANELIDGLEAEERLMLFLHLFDPHHDYIPPGKWATRYDPNYTGTLDGRNYYFNPRIWDEANQKRVVNDRDLQHIYALYKGEIGWADEQIGRLIEKLREVGRLDRTLIVITSDHGEEFFEHGHRGHKLTVFDEVIRVPLLVVPPKALSESIPPSVGAQVELSDILPTVLDYADLDTPPTVFGRSLRPALEGRPFPSRPVVSSLILYTYPSLGNMEVNVYDAVRTPEMKLFRRTVLQIGRPPQLTHVAYRDILRDPLGQGWIIDSPELMARSPQVVAAWDLLEGELAKMRAIHESSDHEPDHERTTNMARLLGDELRQLGYTATDENEPSPGHISPWGLGVRPPLALPGR